MFIQKELEKMKSIIDQNCYTDDEEAMELADKIYDLIQLHKAWAINGHIKIDVIRKVP